MHETNRMPMGRALRPAALLLAVCLWAVPCAWGADAPPGLVPSPLEPATTGGIAVVERALEKLTQHRRLLVIAAHPDDEDSTALALVVRGQGGEAAYLSLSRGEGGQNLIGTELGVGLGLVRSRELSAAREIDGARQFFTRAYDFGYTRSVDETFERWPREELARDVRRVVERFRPQVIVTVFPGDERAGHGQHQAAGVMARQVFEELREAVADGGEMAPEVLLQAAWWDRESATVETDLGRLDPLTGRTLYQVAARSRSQHRSQDMGRVEPLGRFTGAYVREAGPGGQDGEGVEGDLFAGLDTRLEAIAPEAAGPLSAARERAEAARAKLVPSNPAAVVPDFRAILEHLEEARSRVDGPALAAMALLDEKIAVAEAGLAAAAGIAVDAWAERETVVLGAGGEPLRVTAVVQTPAAGKSGNGVEIDVLGLDLVAPSGAEPWSVREAPAEDGGGDVFTPFARETGVATWGHDVRPPASATPTVPYFLERPLVGDMYGWSAAPEEVRGEPFGPPPLTARFRLSVGGRVIEIDREVVHRRGDQAVGEVRRPLRLVPAVEVAVDRDLLVVPADDDQPRSLGVTVSSELSSGVSGTLAVDSAAPGWSAPEPVSFEIAPGDDTAVVTVPLDGHDLPTGSYPLQVTATVGGATFAAAYPQVDYPHIRATPMPRPARVDLVVADLELPRLDRVAYVRGASDRVPEALAAIGVPLEVLSGAELAGRDLSRYDAVVVGPRAYETDPALGAASGHLRAYAEAGGLVIVQYQQYQFVRGGHAFFPLDIARPHDRVTDEAAPPTLLAPDHPAFHHPHEIGPADWDGWVQERGLYFAHTWDDAYQPLLSFPADDATESPGAPLAGALLVAPVGDGTYVYTGLAFFRQLPAGVPGAYRLLLNLMALGEG